MYIDNPIYKEHLKKCIENTKNIEQIKNKRFLITGSTGQIGKFLIDVLMYSKQVMNSNIEIYALVRNEKKAFSLFAEYLEDRSFNLIIGDVIEKIGFEIKTDYIVHLAGDGYPEAFRIRPAETMNTIISGTYNMLEYTKSSQSGRFLFVSSGEIYGGASNKEQAFAENELGKIDILNPRACYPSAKRAAETLTVSYANEYSLDVVIARLCHVYGPVLMENDNRATAQFMRSAIKGENIVLNSSGSQIRSYIHIEDAVSGILTVLLLGLGNQAYNVANPKSIKSIAGFAEELAGIAGVNCVYKCQNTEKTLVDRAILDSRKIEDIGWHARISICEGVELSYQLLKWEYGKYGNHRR